MMIKSVALFGLTGKTGSIIAKKLLTKNYHVKALVRNPLNVSLYSKDLTILKGDVLNESEVKETIRDTDAVITVIGHVKGCLPDLQTLAIKNLLKMMDELNIRRLIDLTGGGVSGEGDNPDLIDRTVTFIMKNLAGKGMKDRFADGDSHVRLIRSTDLDWTIVRAPVLIPRPAKGKTSIGSVGHISGYSLRYEDLADEIINILENNLFVRQLPYITNG
jgi:putative NADH-flavin reductase